MKCLPRVKFTTHISNSIGIGVSIATATLINNCMPYIPSEVFKHTSPSVVTVTSVDMERDPFDPNNLREHVTGTGTGFVYLRDDIVVTNAHIIKDAFKVKIDEKDATILGVDNMHDIAIARVDYASSSTPLDKCDMYPEIGDPVLAIGNPYGFEKTMTYGIISGLHRSLDNDDERTPLVDLIQTDASINPGNSGGPLLDATKGCVIGMNTALVSPNGASSGLGFTVPIDTITNFVKPIIEETTTAPDRLVLGITILPDTYAKGLGIHGVIIANVIPGSLADSLGLKGTYRDENGIPHLGDVIIKINQTDIKKRSDLFQVLEHLKQGDEIDITTRVAQS